VKARMAKSGVAAALALLALSLAGPARARGSKNPGAAWAAARPLTCASMASGPRSSYDRPTLLVAQSSCQWQAAMAVLMANHALEAGPEAEPDGIDWTKQTAVVVAMGTVPYGYSLAVQGARQSSGALLLQVHVDYQSYENNYEDVNPAAVVIVDGQGMNTVQALYDFQAPGLLDQAVAIPCGISRTTYGLGRTSASLDTGPVSSMTWGSLKSVYR
jgi:hypothetical protein